MLASIFNRAEVKKNYPNMNNTWNSTGLRIEPAWMKHDKQV
jgi:hypothetical protein